MLNIEVHYILYMFSFEMQNRWQYFCRNLNYHQVSFEIGPAFLYNRIMGSVYVVPPSKLLLDQLHIDFGAQIITISPSTGQRINLKS